MAGSLDGFDEFSDEEFVRSPLPQDDRLWRHPSEAGSATTWNTHDAVAVQKRWLERETTRGSAWTAGIVGAILATGLVALGTHLATAFTSPPYDASTASIEVTTPTSQLAAASRGAGPTITGLSATMAAHIASVGQSIAVIDAGRGGTNVRSLGVIIRPDGIVMAPASIVSGATSLLVTLTNGVQYVGVSEGSDTTSGIAVIRINGVNALPAIDLQSTTIVPGEMAVAVTSSGGSTYSLGMVGKTDVTADGLVDALMTDVPSTSTPLGSALINAKGNVVGMVTGDVSKDMIATPTWLAMPVANELINTAHVVHGWLGMVNGTTALQPGTTTPIGVVVESVSKNSAASEAGIDPGDVITSLNGKSVSNISDLRGRLYVLAPGSTVHLRVLRDHQYVNFNVLLDDNVPS